MKRLKNFLRKVGRQGASLLFFGGLVAFASLQFLAAPEPLTANQAHSQRFMLELVSRPIWGWIYLAVGVLTLISVGYKRLRPLAFGALEALCIAWGLGLIVGSVGSANLGLTLAVAANGMFDLALAGFLFILSGWRENYGLPD